MKSGIIFDMDGTLWDSSEQVVTAWNESVKRHGYGREPITSAEIPAAGRKTITCGSMAETCIRISERHWKH